MGKRNATPITHNTVDRWIPMKILFHFSFALPLQYFHDPGGSHGNLFLPKWSLVNSQQREKDGGRKGKTRRGEEAKDEEALSLFAFSACKNVGSCYCARRTKASVVLNCLTIFRAVLFFFFVRWWPENGSTSFKQRFVLRVRSQILKVQRRDWNRCNNSIFLLQAVTAYCKAFRFWGFKQRWWLHATRRVLNLVSRPLNWSLKSLD